MISIASKQESATGPGGGDVTIPKPTGLSVGDLLVAFVTCGVAGGSSATYATPSGWTLLQAVTGSTNNSPLYVFAKVAEAADVAATEFTFDEDSGAGDGTLPLGALFRITGTTGFLSPTVNILAVGSYGATYAGITNSFPNSLLLTAFSREDAGDLDFDSYAVANSNPAWTEEYDLNNPGGVDTNMGIASASYTGGGDTGNFTANQAATVASGVLLSITENVNPTVSPAVITMTATVQAPVVAADANVSVTTITMTASVQAPTVTVAAPKWTNQAKNTAAWLNTPKS